ncbi:hypothetical protein K9N68_37175 (plasmid) [Kovacikia minuta CCNUW1]|uniref:hypothetical protein n=1 Tax=Kovacikia minuta TaxID=2931930 RepID=UPI001CCFB01F|nr:hypothetical protein [Kovacikia minuta]UBF29845.1 hypothetical protein K9N68_37175 [Kovacikia minuta CCNUW1]
MRYKYRDQYLDASQVDIYDSFFAYQIEGKLAQGSLAELIPLKDGEVIAFSPPSSSQNQEEEGSSEKEIPAKLLINFCKPSDLAKAVNGIGKQYATRIIARKPDEGYRGWDQLAETNHDLSLNWEEIRKDSEELISFETLERGVSNAD